jgi:hypothetical protein
MRRGIALGTRYISTFGITVLARLISQHHPFGAVGGDNQPSAHWLGMSLSGEMLLRTVSKLEQCGTDDINR